MGDGYNVPVNTGTLSGVVFNDENNNGIQDAGELGLPGVDVVITDMDGNIQTVMTDANGNWTATVVEGDATVDVDETTLEDGSVLTTAGSDPETVTVIADENTATTDDGYISDGVITGTV